MRKESPITVKSGEKESKDMSRPLVTVILPSLNVKDYIEECLASVCAQTLADLEILCIDAGSTDGTEEMINRFVRKDHRVRLIHSDMRSYGRQLNIGIDVARGRYIGIVETDDAILPDMYRRLSEVAEANAVEVVKSDYYHFTGSVLAGWRTVKRCAANPDLYTHVVDPREDLRAFAFAINCACLYSTDFLRTCDIRFNETPGASYQDIGFFYQVHSHARRMAFLAEPFYLYRQDNPSSSINDKGKVYACCGEYEFLRDRIRNGSDAYDCVKAMLGRGLFYGYLNALKRIAPQFRMEFVERFSLDLRGAKKKGEITQDSMGAAWSSVEQLLNAPQKFLKTIFPKADETLAVKTTDPEPIRKMAPIDIPADGTLDLLGMSIKISVIVPVYNAEKYLRECLDSVLAQTLREIEVVCVDDGSTDASLSILKDYASRDSRVVVLSQTNEGGSIARNRALDVAQGEFLAFLDADDLYPSSGTLQLLYENAKLENAKVVGGVLERFDPDRPGEMERPNMFPFLREGWNVYADAPFDFCYQCFLFDRRMIMGNAVRFPSVSRYQDPPFMVQAMMAARKFYFTGVAAYRYRFGHQNINWQKNGFRKLRDMFSSMALTVRIASVNGLDRVINTTHWRILKDYGKIIFEDYPESTGFPEFSYLLSTFPDEYRHKLEDRAADCLKSLLKSGVRAREMLARYEQSVGSLAFVKNLARLYFAERDKLIECLDAMRYVPEVRRASIRKVGFLYYQMTIGGVQRVMTTLVSIFQRLGYEVVFITEKSMDGSYCPIPEDVSVRYIPISASCTALNIADRIQALADVIREESIDVLYDHEYTSHLLQWDILTAKLICKIPVLLHYHSCVGITLYNVASVPVFSCLPALMRMCDFVITLSRNDELYFNMQGVHARYMINPAPDSLHKIAMRPFVSRFAAQKVVWCARLGDEKLPMDAIEVFAKVHAAMPNVRFVMVGGGAEQMMLAIKKRIAELGIEGCVELVGNRHDPYPYYESASVFLLTSAFEGFALTLMEAGSFGLPTVMYSLPFLETVRGNEGVVQVPQRDIESAAAALCELLSDEELYCRRAKSGCEHMCALMKSDIPSMISAVMRHLQGDSKLLPPQAELSPEDFRLLLEQIQYCYDHGFRALQQRKVHTSSLLLKKNYTLPKEKDIQRLKAQVVARDQEIFRLKNAEAYRVGMLVTWPFRIIYRKFCGHKK